MTHRHYRKSSVGNPFPDATVFWCGDTESTMDDAAAAWRAGSLAGAATAVHGTTLVADFQRRGRGRRREREWNADAGENVLMTVCLTRGHPSLPLSFLPLLCGLAVCRAVESTAEQIAAVDSAAREGDVKRGADVKRGVAGTAALKWPNDVLIGEKKVAGVLCEHRQELTLVGIGINVNQLTFPGELRRQATSLRLSYGAAVERAGLVGETLAALAAALEDEAALAQCRSRLYARGKTVELDQDGPRGTLVGIAEDGALILGERPGVRKRYYSGELRVIG